MTSSHTGANLAAKVYECLTAFKIADKVVNIVGDNAENNSTMVTALNELVQRKTRIGYVRCLNHVLNLVVKVR